MTPFPLLDTTTAPHTVNEYFIEMSPISIQVEWDTSSPIKGYIQLYKSEDGGEFEPIEVLPRLDIQGTFGSAFMRLELPQNTIRAEYVSEDNLQPRELRVHVL